jgi:hypothetical protein
MNLSLFQKISVEWRDTVLDHSGWQELDSYTFDTHKLSMYYETTGFFLKKEDGVLFLCQSYREKGEDYKSHIACILGIPEGCIEKITVLKEK